jgi:hypothetical protein
MLEGSYGLSAAWKGHKQHGHHLLVAITGTDCSLLGCTPTAGPHGLLSGLEPGAASAVKVAVIDLLMAQPPTPPAYSDVASAIAAAATANAQLARKSPKNAAPTSHHQQRGAGTGVAASPFAAVSPRMASVTGGWSHVCPGHSKLPLLELVACGGCLTIIV